VKLAVQAGIHTKINCVLIPNINTKEIPEIAKYYASINAHIMNIMPLIPLHKMAKLPPPTCEELNETRNQCEEYIKQFRYCKQCRADAVGVPGLEKQA
jgi:nitrogen fixation protein NifB